MRYTLRALRMLAIVVWAGGLIFFAFIEAPTASHVMGTTREFALLIAGSIRGINRIGWLAGDLFLVSGFLLMLWPKPSARDRKFIRAELILVVLMIAATAYVQNHIVPAMDRDRISVGGDINSVPADNPTRVHFDSLHAASEKVEGAALFLGIGVVLLMAAEDGRPESVPVAAP